MLQRQLGVPKWLINNPNTNMFKVINLENMCAKLLKKASIHSEVIYGQNKHYFDVLFSGIKMIQARDTPSRLVHYLCKVLIKSANPL